MRSSKRLSDSLGEQKGTIEYDKEGERVTVNFEKKLEVIDRFSRERESHSIYAYACY